MNDVLFRLKDVNKSYRKGKDTINIFDRLHLEIKQGDFIAIMGPSGSGKTTLLNMLGGVDSVDDGVIECVGEKVSALSESGLSKWRANTIGFIFQFYNLMPTLNAAKNVELPLLLTKMSRSQRKERVKIALELVGLAEHAKHYPNEMSGGQQQRVAIARAIIADPKLLLCDEPTGDLDRATANEILEILKLLNKEQGKTIIMVTHDPSAANFAKKVLHLDKGRFVESDNH